LSRSGRLDQFDERKGRQAPFGIATPFALVGAGHGEFHRADLKDAVEFGDPAAAATAGIVVEASGRSAARSATAIAGKPKSAAPASSTNSTRRIMPSRGL
jgi:hypothetical protein